MQYILTQEEYDSLSKKKLDLASRHIANLQRACTLAADHVPVMWGWGGEWDAEFKKRLPEVAKPWGCMITKEANSEYGDSEWYCDECPVQKECPYEYKSYSK
jgi:hypothetical protein